MGLWRQFAKAKNPIGSSILAKYQSQLRPYGPPFMHSLKTIRLLPGHPYGGTQGTPKRRPRRRNRPKSSLGKAVYPAHYGSRRGRQGGYSGGSEGREVSDQQRDIQDIDALWHLVAGDIKALTKDNLTPEQRAQVRLHVQWAVQESQAIFKRLNPN
jgi:hypothetical protein